MDNRTTLALFALLVSALIGSALVKPWEVPNTNLEKWKRSLIIGLVTSSASVIAIVIVVWNTGTIVDVARAAGGLFMCLGLPAGIIATLGFYIGYRQVGWLLDKKEEIKKRTISNK